MAGRILLVGCSGSGKSTAARALAAKTGLPLYHLDKLYWRPGWAEPDAETWRVIQAPIVAQPRWIIDGNYSGTIDLRLARAELILLFDLPTWLCLWRIIGRLARWRGRVRDDMGDGCPERFNVAFLVYVLNFRRRSLPRLHDKIARSNVPCIVLRSPAEVDRLLADLPRSLDQFRASPRSPARRHPGRPPR